MLTAWHPNEQWRQAHEPNGRRLVLWQMPGPKRLDKPNRPKHVSHQRQWQAGMGQRWKAVSLEFKFRPRENINLLQNVAERLRMRPTASGYAMKTCFYCISVKGQNESIQCMCGDSGKTLRRTTINLSEFRGSRLNRPLSCQCQMITPNSCLLSLTVVYLLDEKPGIYIHNNHLSCNGIQGRLIRLPTPGRYQN